jgi:L-arabinose isomerase
MLTVGHLRTGFVSVRFALFDPQMAVDFPERMQAEARRLATVLERDFDVVYPGLIEDEAGAERVGRALAAERLDAIVFAPVMAAPPSYAVTALAGCTAPLVIWNAPGITRLGPDISQADATEHTTTVGCLMYANVLCRRGTPAPVVTASPVDRDGLERLRRTIVAVAAAGSLRGATVLRVGDPLPGYLDVEAASDELAQLGVREHAVAKAELDAAFHGASPDDVRAVLEDVAARRWSGDPGPNAARSAQLAHALSTLMAQEQAACGTVNCHGPLLRFGQEIGITACLAVALLTARGRPLSCTGDQPTALALYLAQRLSGAGLYCECYAPEIETGLLLLAAGGEGDPAWAEPPESITLEANDHYPGTHGAGTSVSFGLRRGPATLLSLSPGADGWRLAWSTGEIVETRYRHMRGPNGMFHFDSGSSGEVVSRWIASGATHHNALAPGRLDVEIPALAQALGIRAVRV